MYSIETLTDHEAFAALGDQWDTLLSEIAAHTLFNTFAWQQCWIKHYWQPAWQLHLSVFRVEGIIVAILPLYFRPEHRTYYFLGSGEDEAAEVASEYLDILISDKHADIDGLYTVIRKLLQSQLKHIVKLVNVLEGAHIARLISASGKCVQQVSGCTYRLPLGESLDHTIAPFSSRRRWRIRNNLKKFSALEHADFSCISPMTPTANYAEMWGQLRELHQQEWLNRGQPGAMGTATFNNFHHAMHLEHPEFQQGFSVLRQNDKPCSIHHYYLYRGICYFYLTGTDRQCTLTHSPGMLLHYLCFDVLSGSNLVYDCLKGKVLNSYKEELAIAGQHFLTLTLYPASFAGTLRLFLNNIKQRLKRLR